MSEKFELVVTTRDQIGKGASRRLRRLENLVPAIIYGGENAPINISIEHNHLKHTLAREAAYTSILNLKLNGGIEKAILRDIQRHPSKPRIVHVDFMRVNPTDVITMRVPLHFLNEEKCPGVKAGGLVSHTLSEVEIKCQAQHLPEFIAVDLAKLELNHTIHLSDLVLPANVHLAHAVDEDHDAPVVSVHILKVLTEEEENAAAEAAAAAAAEAAAEAEAGNES